MWNERWWRKKMKCDTGQKTTIAIRCAINKFVINLTKISNNMVCWVQGKFSKRNTFKCFYVHMYYGCKYVRGFLFLMAFSKLQLQASFWLCPGLIFFFWKGGGGGFILWKHSEQPHQNVTNCAMFMWTNLTLKYASSTWPIFLCSYSL